MDTTAWLEDVEARARDRIDDGAARSPRSLTVLYDPSCALCQRCRAWMLGQATAPSWAPGSKAARAASLNVPRGPR